MEKIWISIGFFTVVSCSIDLKKNMIQEQEIVFVGTNIEDEILELSKKEIDKIEKDEKFPSLDSIEIYSYYPKKIMERMNYSNIISLAFMGVNIQEPYYCLSKMNLSSLKNLTINTIDKEDIKNIRKFHFPSLEDIWLEIRDKSSLEKILFEYISFTKHKKHKYNRYFYARSLRK